MTTRDMADLSAQDRTSITLMTFAAFMKLGQVPKHKEDGRAGDVRFLRWQRGREDDGGKPSSGRLGLKNAIGHVGGDPAGRRSYEDIVAGRVAGEPLVRLDDAAFGSAVVGRSDSRAARPVEPDGNDLALTFCLIMCGTVKWIME